MVRTTVKPTRGKRRFRRAPCDANCEAILEGRRVSVVSSLMDALEAAGDEPEVCIIGGAELYRLALPRTGLIHLTPVHATVAADTHIPELVAREWDEVVVEERPADARHSFTYSFVELRRRRVG